MNSITNKEGTKRVSYIHTLHNEETCQDNTELVTILSGIDNRASVTSDQHTTKITTGLYILQEKSRNFKRDCCIYLRTTYT